MWTTSTAMDIIPLSIASHFMCKECSLDLVFFMQIDSGWRRQKWHRVNNMGLVDIVDAVHTFLIHLRMDMDHINSDGFLSIIIQHSVSYANRVLTPNLTFCGKNDSQTQQKWHSVDHKGHVDAVRRSSHISYISKEGYESLEQQWMPFLASSIVSYFSCW